MLEGGGTIPNVVEAVRHSGGTGGVASLSNGTKNGSPSLVWGWVLRQRGRGGLSTELSATLIAAAEVLLSPELKPIEVKAICRAAAARLYQLPTADRAEICGHLEMLEKLVPLLPRVGRGFSGLSLDARRKCILGCERSLLPLVSHGHAKLRHLVLMAYMHCPEAWPTSDTLPDLESQVA